MNTPENQTPKELVLVAYDIALEVYSGKWDHAGADKQPVPACAAVMDEFKERRPGFSRDQYERAMDKGLSMAR